MSDQPAVRVDLTGVRRRLDGTQGRTYWKSLEELARTPEFLEFLHREFPQQASELERLDMDWSPLSSLAPSARGNVSTNAERASTTCAWETRTWSGDPRSSAAVA